MRLEYEMGWFKLTSPYGRIMYMRSLEDAIAYCFNYYQLFGKSI